MMSQISESKFNWWRALVALVHVDHVVDDKEREFFLKRFDKIDFSSEQEKILYADLKAPQDVKKLFLKIVDKEQRASFIYFARMLFWSDGVFDQQEKKILDVLQDSTASKIDLVGVMNDVTVNVERSMSEYNEERGQSEEDLYDESWFGKAYYMLKGLTR